MHLLSTRKRRRSALAATVALIAIGGGVGYAYWSGTGGTGTGTVTTGTSGGFTVAGGTATGGLLTPGGPTDSVPFTVTNASTGGQMLNGVTAVIADENGDPWTAAPGCSAADYTVGTPVIAPGSIAGGGTRTGAVSITMKETGVDQDACKDAAVPLYFVAS